MGQPPSPSVDNPEDHIAGERAAGSGHYNLACGRAARDDGGHEGVGGDVEAGRGDAVEGDAGCAGQALAENLCGLSGPADRKHKGDERPQAHVKTEDCSCASGTTAIALPVDGSVGMLRETCIRVLWAAIPREVVDPRVHAPKGYLKNRSDPIHPSAPCCAV